MALQPRKVDSFIFTDVLRGRCLGARRHAGRGARRLPGDARDPARAAAERAAAEGGDGGAGEDAGGVSVRWAAAGNAQTK